MTSSETHNAPDPTDQLDAEIIYQGQGPNASIEALNVRGVLEANGLTVLGTNVELYPSFPVLLRVPKDQLEKARRVLAEAEAAGPKAAEADALAAVVDAGYRRAALNRAAANGFGGTHWGSPIHAGPPMPPH